MLYSDAKIGNKIISIIYNNQNVHVDSLEEKVKLLIVRDLFRLDWDINYKKENISISPPKNYDKKTIKKSMSVKREEVLLQNSKWIKKHIDLAKINLANGKEAFYSPIEPIIEECKTDRQHSLFRILRYYWSSPYSEYVGRRIKLLIRDNALPNKPIIGIAALGSPIIHIPERDNYIEWDKNTRTKNLVYAMDAYVLGALPPYNYLLGGKLISYIIASNEVRKIYSEKYADKITNIEKRIAKDLVCIFTTSLYGKSSQYNRIKYDDKLLYEPIGYTKGFGTLHLTDETFSAMIELLKSKNILITNRFGDGPSWRMRVIRSVGDIIGIDPDFLLRHSFRRSIYLVPLAENYKAFLNDEDKTIIYKDYPLEDLVRYWKKRWLCKRKKYLLEKDEAFEVLNFNREDFNIEGC